MLGVRIPPGLPDLIMNPAESLKNWTDSAKQFYADVRSEMRKVSWPNRQEVIGTTIVVIVSVFFFGLYLFAVDQALGYGLNWVLRHFGITTGGA
jgi:preprotein translocase subunit SecE